MIIDFSVQNFGSVKDKQTISFEADKSDLLEDYYIIRSGKYRLLKLALIYGANASGKTTVLNALDFFDKLVESPLQRKTDRLVFEPYLFDEKTSQQNSILEMNFLQKDIHYFYRIEFNRQCIVSEELNFYNPNKANVFRRTTDLGKQLAKVVFGSKIKSDKTLEYALTANTLWNNTVLGGFLKTNIDLPEIKNATDWFYFYLKPLIKPGSRLSGAIISKIHSSELKKSDILSILKRADFNISDIKIDNTLSEHIAGQVKSTAAKSQLSAIIVESKNIKTVDLGNLLFQHTINDKSYDLHFDSESEGTQRYFGLAGILGLLINESLLFPIDELESSLHPDLYVHFLLSFLANAKKSQLIATTHNREILGNKDLFRNDAIWFTDKSATGATELYSLADFDSSVVRDTTSVYNAYKIGKLGGLPNLGDYFIDLEK